MPFDTITLGAERRRVSVLEFLAMPLDERVGFILNRQIEFLRDGKAINRGVALKSLLDSMKKSPAGNTR
jgi:hypothetical protein